MRRGAEIAEQIYGSAVEPLWGLLGISVLLGAGAIVGLNAVMRPNALVAYIPSVIAIGIVREGGPLFVAAVMVLRSSRTVRGEGDRGQGAGEGTSGGALEGFLSRVAGALLSALGLWACMSAAALLGGYFIVEIFDRMPLGLRLADILAAMSPAVIAAGLGRAAAFGAVAGAIGCFLDWRTSPSFRREPG